MQLRSDAQIVLLNPQYRSSYDLAHTTLHQIAALRASLGLQHSQNWSTPLCTDFPAPPTHSQVAALKKKLKGETSPSGSTKTKRSVWALLIVVIAFVVVWSVVRKEQNSPYLLADTTPSSSYRVSPVRPIFTEPVQPTPHSGTVTQRTAREAVAPFGINSASDANYLVKLVDAFSKAEVMTVFVRGGFPVEVKVPLGTYEIRYASGNFWYGYEHLFGPDTSYAKADQTFDFQVVGNRVSGFTLTLYKVRNGNLHTSQISARDF